MTIGLTRSGIVRRIDAERAQLVIPHPGGGPASFADIPRALGDAWNLATGDFVQGELRDRALETLVSVNGVPAGEARDRPAPRANRGSYERVRPHVWLRLASSPGDLTGRMADFACPLGRGMAGIVHGPHGSGLTRTLQAVVQGVHSAAPELIPLILLTRARSEEITDWRRRFPDCDVVAGPSTEAGASAEDALLVAELVLECAQRQTELGRHVLLIIDSLTGLWADMLESEEADAQREADRAEARARIRVWLQKAGDFGGEGLLGGGLGGSLTIVGTVWSTAVDVEAEEEGELHPHLRLLEHVVPDSSWRCALSGALASRRLFPAIDLARCQSLNEDTLLPPEILHTLVRARAALSGLEPPRAWSRLVEAIESSDDLASLARQLAADAPVPSQGVESLRKLLSFQEEK